MPDTSDKYRIFCAVCLEDYDKKKHVPRFNPTPGCGHTVCSSCLPKLLPNSPFCVFCRTPCCSRIQCKPVNQPLLEACCRLKKLRNPSQCSKNFYEKLSEEIELNTYGEVQIIPCGSNFCEISKLQRRIEKQTDEQNPSSESTENPEQFPTNWQFKQAMAMINELVTENKSLESQNSNFESNSSHFLRSCGSWIVRKGRNVRDALSDSANIDEYRNRFKKIAKCVAFIVFCSYWLWFILHYVLW